MEEKHGNLTDSEYDSGKSPKGMRSGPVRFFLIMPANALLGLLMLYQLPDTLLPAGLAASAMGGGIIGASFGIGTYPDTGAGRFTWHRVTACLAILDALALLVGYGLTALAVYTGVTEEQYWAHILLLFLSWGIVDSLTPLVATRIAGPAGAAPDEEAQP